MTAPGLAYQLLDGAAAAEREDDLLALAAEVGGDDAGPAPPGGPGCGGGSPASRSRRRGTAATWSATRPGMPLRPSTSWWRGLTTPLPPEVTTEHPGRTFALTELLVRASWRRQGIGRELHDLLLDGRPEERATLTVPPGAGAAQRAFPSWGWRKVARTRGDGPAAPVLDVLLLDLPGRRSVAARCSMSAVSPRCGRGPKICWLTSSTGGAASTDRSPRAA